LNPSEPSPTQRLSPLALWAATAAAAGVLSAAVLGGILFAIVSHGRTSGRGAPPGLARWGIVRRLFMDPGYRNLLAVLRQQRATSFETVWDFDTATLLESGQFDSLTIDGRRSYRRRPKVHVAQIRVFSGVGWVNLTAVETPELLAALGRCRLVRDVRWETDELGFKRTAAPRAPGQASVLFLGDSFTEGMYVRSEDTFASLFGGGLKAAGYDAAALNAGVAGYGVAEENWTAERFAERVDARLLIVSLYLNDVHGDPRRVMSGAVPQRNWRRLLRELDHLDGVCRSRQLGLIVAVIPDKEQLGAGPSVLGFQQRIDHWCHDVGVRCLDALPYFETHGAASNYFAWDAHLSEEGHRNYASFLLEAGRSILDERLPRVASQ
jgi:lysophospholipase L1-like esterase